MAFYSNFGLGPRTIAKLIPDNAKVLHIGADNGNIAYALVNKGHTPKNLFLCENDYMKFQTLCQKFPGYSVYYQDAMHLQYILPPKSFDVIVSSVPPSVLQEKELNDFKILMKPGGKFLQITYKLEPPFKSFETNLSNYVPLNVLPMYIWEATY